MAAQTVDKFSAIGALVDVRVQSPKWSFTKRDDRGGVEFVSPLPTPFNYGCVDAWRGEDGDAVDALILGPRLPGGYQARMRVRAVVQFEDAGRDDFKCVCSAQDLSSVERVWISVFFVVYAAVKNVLNALRGTQGSTRFGGWIVMKR